MNWLVKEWPYATLLAAAFLLLAAPFLVPLGLPLLLIYLMLPMYMVHQAEEHFGDRFRKWINGNFGSREVLTPWATFVINSAGVWGVDLLGLYLAYYVSIGLGLMAIYLPVINGVSHIVGAVVKRSYNPGLVTSVVLFLPLGIWALAVVSPRATWGEQALGLGLSLLVHAAILAHLRLRLRKLAAHG